MRKAAGLLFAMGLLIPAGVLAAAPAGSAVAGPTCNTFTASVTVTPPLPRLGESLSVIATVRSIGKIGGCKGDGVSYAAFTDSYKYRGNCTTFVTGKGGVTTPGPSSLSWSNGKASVATTTAALVSKVGVTPVILKITSKITKGQFVGTTASGNVKATSPAGTCKTSGLAKATLTGSGSFTFN
ncbi:MAG: hypothetical protein ACLPVY_22230 [Acidimicrobiia bacterium]